MGEDEHAGLGVGAADLAGSDDALVAVGGWHADVDERDVWFEACDALEQGFGVLDCGDDVDASVCEQAGDALAQEQLVVGDYDPQGSSTSSTRFSACGRRWIVPPAAPTRSESRVRSRVGASVATSRMRVSPSRCPSIVTRLAAGSCAASATTK